MRLLVNPHDSLPSLPEPPREPLPADHPRLRRLLKTPSDLPDALGTSPVLMVLRTATTHDTGRWFVNSTIYLLAVPDALILFTHGKRPLLRRLPVADLTGSFYNHITGSLVLDPDPDAAADLPPLRIPPLDAYRILALIRWSENTKTDSGE